MMSHKLHSSPGRQSTAPLPDGISRKGAFTTRLPQPAVYHVGFVKYNIAQFSYPLSFRGQVCETQGPLPCFGAGRDVVGIIIGIISEKLIIAYYAASSIG